MDKAGLKENRMLTGSVFGEIIRFAIPLLIGTVFQQAYNLVDTAIAGHFLGDEALSAIGATSSVFTFILYMSAGLNGGFSIIIANSYGAENTGKIRACIAKSVQYNLVFGAVVMVFSLTALKPVLRLMNTPDAIFGEAYKYIFIILICVLSNLLYNGVANFLRALGNSRVPLYFLIISTVLNIVLDYIFIVSFHMGVSGTAVATVVAQTVSGILCMWYFVRSYPDLVPGISDLKNGRQYSGELLSAGTSMALMNSIFSIGSLILQVAINNLGTAILAAHLGARKIAELFMQPLITLSSACSTFISQNYGAGKTVRIKRALIYSILCGIGISVLSLVLAMSFGRSWIVLLCGTQDSVIIDNAFTYLKVNMPFYPFLMVLFALRMSVQSIGGRVQPLVSSAMELGSKTLSAFLLTPMFGYMGVCVAEPVSWVLGAVFLLFAFPYRYKKTKQLISVNSQ